MPLERLSTPDAGQRYWDLSRHEELRQLMGHAKATCSVANSPDGHLGLSGSRQYGRLGLHDLKHGGEIRRFAGHRPSVRNVQTTRDGRLILSAGSGSPRLWDAATGAEVYQIQGAGGAIVCGTNLPGNREVLFGCYDTTVRLWRLPTSVGEPKAR